MVNKQGKQRAISQILHGKVIATYPSTVEAAKATKNSNV